MNLEKIKDKLANVKTENLVILKTEEKLSPDEYNSLIDEIHEIIPDNDLFILDGGEDIDIVTI